jgi:L-idonate 5-dehydrogenase
MKAIVIHSARDLRVEQRDAGEPGPGEVRIAMAAGGICGSDLHYYNHGGFGTVRLREPMILGHEVAGHVEAVGPGVTRVKAGDLVAINPSRPCGSCRYCAGAEFNHCLNMAFYGSAMPFPHVQGAFRSRLVALESQCEKVAPGITAGEAAMAEPFSVALHAVAQAGGVAGKRVLVTGCGPIGALCLIAARHLGAADVVVSDIAKPALEFARRLGADAYLDAASAVDFEPYALDKGSFDVVLECSGSAAALATALQVARPRATIVQLGLGGDMSLPMNMLVAKEISLRGSFRFHPEFAQAVSLINDRSVDLKPLISETFDIGDAVAAFDMASDRSRAMKVQLAF